MNPIDDLLAAYQVIPLQWRVAGTAVICLAIVAVMWLQIRRVVRSVIAKARSTSVEDNLTFVAASIATGVSAQGMWRFTGDVLGLWWPLRVVLFAFIEVAIVTSAVRARRSMRENFSAGVDGIAVWVLASLTAVLSSMDSSSLPEAVFRLAAPLVAAWLWERGMRLERRRRRGMSGINWRLTPERILVRLGLAEATDRTASEVDAHRRITRVALAAKRVHLLRLAGASERKVRRAAARLDRRLDQAVEHTGLARDDRMKWALLDQVATLGGAEQLCALLDGAQGPWAQTDHPLVTGRAKHHEASRLADAMREWADAVRQQHDPDATADATADATDERPDTRPAVVAPAVPFPVATSVATSVADDGDQRDRTGDRDGDRDGDRERPDEQDNREARDWIRARCRGRNGVGRKPSKTEVAKRFGFSETWAFDRVREVQDRMTAQGYTFEPDGTVLAPSRSVADSDATEVSA
jgi:hypothetical protein